MAKTYDPRQDWYLWSTQWIGLHGGEYQFSFLTFQTYQGEKLVRNIYADTEEEAWTKLAEMGRPRP
jgi:hypothetical protein